MSLHWLLNISGLVIGFFAAFLLLYSLNIQGQSVGIKRPESITKRADSEMRSLFPTVGAHSQAH
jgi:hypothetical protein